MNDRQLIDILQTKLVGEPALYAPLRVANFEMDRRQVNGVGRRWSADATFELQWMNASIRCVAEFYGDATPKRVADAIRGLDDRVATAGINAEPILVVPYLSAGIAEQLELFGVSGLDLNGNYYILSDGLVAVRLDRPNEYTESRDIKNIYTYNSSIVGRFFMATNRNFEQVNEIYDGIRGLGGDISLSTVSKVLKGLNEDLIISRKRGEIRLLQPEKLLDQMRDGYRSARVGQRLELKLPMGEENEILSEILGADNWLWSGDTSATAYTATTPTGVKSAYTTRFASSMEPLREFENSRFYNCVIKQTDDNFVYFDRRGQWTSPVEAYLELSQGDKRELEIARSIRENVILTEFNDNV